MSVHIIIDGYNLIRQSSDLSAIEQQDMQEGRKALIQRLAAYRKFKPHKITVVFDGTNAPGMPRRKFSQAGVAVRFSRLGQTADSVIRQMASTERQKALVVTSDQALAKDVAFFGSDQMGSAAFLDKMEMAAYMAQKGGEVLEEDEKPRFTGTQKKGPGRRLPKKARRLKKRLKKL